MSSNLIENETDVYYTVFTSEGVSVSDSHFHGGEVQNVQVTRKSYRIKKYPSEEVAQKVAAYINGKIIKHTRTRIVTEVTEELNFKEEF